MRIGTPSTKKKKQTAMCQNDDEPQKQIPFSWDHGKRLAQKVSKSGIDVVRENGWTRNVVGLQASRWEYDDYQD